MSDWLEALRKLEQEGTPSVLVTLLAARGSTPRGPGSKMVVSETGRHGSIGGGNLEFQSERIARELLADPAAVPVLRDFPLGPELGQCCGGSVRVLFEPMRPPSWQIALFGAGHVGQALVRLLGALPCHVTWIDSRPGALPDAEWTGNPIREELEHVDEPKARYAARSGPLRVLVVGGSLGAAALNEVVPRALALIAPDERPFVVHQAGAKHIEALKANYIEAGIEPGERAQLVPFIDDMARVYHDADLVICRSGAMTVAEIAAVGVAACFVPFPLAVDDHQTTNAAFLADKGAARVVQQRDLTAESLAAWLQQQTRESLADMAARARALAKPDAADQVASICAAVAGASPGGKQ